ncbi:MAG: hypothetical protein Q8L71_10570, partial [Thiobacillus sp.]|nr:hypothetical protein [Thiobacillus sp.]
FSVNGDSPNYRYLLVKMRLRLGGKVLRKHKVAGINKTTLIYAATIVLKPMEQTFEIKAVCVS